MISVFVVVFSASEQIPLSDGLCADNQDYYAFNNPEECRAFWICQNGQPQAGMCPENHNFNELQGTCVLDKDFPCNTGDNLESTTVETTTDENIPDETTIGVDTNHPTVPPPSNFPCPPGGIQTFQLPGSCTEFRLCFAGHDLRRSCATGLHYDAAINSCNFIELANCARDVCPLTNDPDLITTFASRTDCRGYVTSTIKPLNIII